MAMHYWLFKSEPSTWSWGDQIKCGVKGTHWNGIRNFQARNNLKLMKKGDQGFFYHSGDERQIWGLVEVIKEAYPDQSADPEEGWCMVDIKATKAFKKPVSLSDIKEHPLLENMVLLRQGRLSVSPVTKKEFEIILKMAS